jgi:hypothetical protein
MINGEPVAEPLSRFAAIPTFPVIMLVTGSLRVLLFLGGGCVYVSGRPAFCLGSVLSSRLIFWVWVVIF